MRNSNLKIFTAFTYLLLLILILGSVTFLIVQRIQRSRQADVYINKIVDRINSSYIGNGSFTTLNFTKDVKDVMQEFKDLVKVITIVDNKNVMQNRFRVDSLNATDDPNPNWQNQLKYRYNPLLYEEQSHNLQLPGQSQVSVQVLFQRLPIQLIKDVLQFDTVVILALLILSFLAFLIIPKRDPTETAWALQSLAEEEDMYHEVEQNEEQPIYNGDPWLTQDLAEADTESRSEEDSSTDFDDDENATTAHEYGNTVITEAPEGDTNGIPDNDIDIFAGLLDPETEAEIDLSFNDDSPHEDMLAPRKDGENGKNDEDTDLKEGQLELPSSPAEVAPSTDFAFLDDIGSDESAGLDDSSDNALESERLDDLLTEAIQELDNGDESPAANKDDQDFAASLNREFGDLAADDELEGEANSGLDTEMPEIYDSEFEEDLGDELINDLDEGLGDDELEPIEQELDADILSQWPTAEEQLYDGNEADETERDQTEAELDSETTTENQDILDTEQKQAVLNWIGDFLENQKDQPAAEEDTSPDLSVALLQTLEEDVEIVRASLEQDLAALQASILPHQHGMAILLPSKNIHEGIEQLQNAASRLPASYLKNMKMGITGISAARKDIGAETVLTELEYALTNCDAENNISIFDANDQIFNQRQN